VPNPGLTCPTCCLGQQPALKALSTRDQAHELSFTLFSGCIKANDPDLLPLLHLPLTALLLAAVSESAWQPPLSPILTLTSDPQLPEAPLKPEEVPLLPVLLETGML
jgi:hypothetical protein